jgi:hypothetical protein
MKHRYIVYNPPYNACSAGVRMMHYIPTLLDMLGLPVLVKEPCQFNPLLGVTASAGPFNPLLGAPAVACEGDVAIYADYITGNPFGADRCVRFLCCPKSRFTARRLAAGDWPGTAKETFGSYQEGYLEPNDGMTPADCVTIPTIEAAAWLFAEPKTIPALLYVGNKGNVKVGPDLENLPRIGYGGGGLGDRERTLALLRKTAAIYTTDLDTVMVHEAALAGCKVFYVLGKGDYRERQGSPGELISQAMGFTMRPARDAGKAATLHALACFGLGLNPADF